MLPGLMFVALLLLGACAQGPGTPDAGPPRVTALAPPGVDILWPPPVGPDRR